MSNKDYVLNKISETQASDEPWRHLVIKDFIVFTDHNLNVPRKMPIKKEFLTKMFTVIKKIKPSRDEVTSNPRSRSAKINVLEKQQ